VRVWILGPVLSVVLVATPLWAQRGGGSGHGGMGGNHGFAGGGLAGHAGVVSGHAVTATHGWRGNGWNGGHGNGWGWRGNGWNGWHGNGWGWRGNRWWWRNPWWGWGWSWYPGWGNYGWYGYPGYGNYNQSDAYSNSLPQYDSSYAYLPPSGSTASSASADEVQRIQYDVDQLRAEEAVRRSQPQEPLIHGDTVLVYKDGHTETVSNYAIAGNTLWIFNQSRAKKVSLTELNLTATKRDNEEHGVQFVLPNAR
jgi:hypothetical protein